MYKTILVEDQLTVRRAIAAEIDWQKHGFVLAGEADNGQDALELMQQIEPDLVITDILMPHMDGIALATRIRQRYPRAKIVFLSSAGEFEYALSALKLNVMEYLVKPVTGQRLSALLDEVRDKLDGENAQAVQVPPGGCNGSRAILRIGFLVNLLKGRAAPETISKKIDEYVLQLRGEHFLLCAFMLNAPNQPYQVATGQDCELRMLSIASTAAAVAGEHLGAECFFYEENIIVIFSASKARLDEFADSTMRKIQRQIQEESGALVTVGVSRRFFSLMDAPQAYRESVAALHYRLTGVSGRILYINDFEQRDKPEFLLSEDKLAEFHTLIKTGTVLDLDRFMEALFQELCQRQASLRCYQLCILELLSQLIKSMKHALHLREMNLEEHLHYIAQLYRQESGEDIRRWFCLLCQEVMEAIGQQCRAVVEVVAERAWDYIQLHYGDSDLSLRSLSSMLHVSPNYLSAIIKKEKGDSFTSLLAGVRMKKAYELLLSTNCTIQEIALATGYSDRHYFSHCFKKYYGDSPVRLRNRMSRRSSVDTRCPVST